MRHRSDHRKLGRTRAHRKAMLANMVTSLFDKERIRTTDAKAKEARRAAERLITRAKKGYAAHQEHESLKGAGKDAEATQMQAVALAHWRQAGRVVRKPAVLRKLFETIAPLYLEREGGYTRILRLGTRPGDNAREVLLELVGTAATKAPIVKGKKGEAAAEGETEGEGKKAKGEEEGKARRRRKPEKKTKAHGAEGGADATPRRRGKAD